MSDAALLKILQRRIMVLDDQCAAQAKVLSECRSALSVADGSLRGVLDVFHNLTEARDAALDCRNAIRSIDALSESKP